MAPAMPVQEPEEIPGWLFHQTIDGNWIAVKD
jgi:hypothetical protein